MTIIGTRPEIIRLSEVIKALDASLAFDQILVHTGQNYDYELNQIFFSDLGLRQPDVFLNAAGATPMETVGSMLAKVDVALLEHKPEAVLILGDTNSALCAIAAKRRHIPIFHMEAGNRSFDERVPEETNRRIVDHIADYNLPYSDIAREYLLREGIAPQRIIKTGSPMFEVLHAHMDKIEASNILSELNLTKDQYFVVSAHREENVSNDEGFFDLMETLDAMANEYGLPIIVSTHPRTRKQIDEKKIQLNPLIRFEKPFGFSDYIRLQMDAKTVLSDSGTISEETSILNLKSLNIRNSHERPEAMEEGTVMMVGLKKDKVLNGLQNISQEKKRIVKDYDIPNVSTKVTSIILSYYKGYITNN